MIDITEETAEGLLEIRATGRVTEQDYETILIPALTRALDWGAPVRLLYQVGPDFEGYSAGALWADARLGLKHWRGFGKIAVVTDSDKIEAGVRMFGFTLPCPVRTFDLDEIDAARLWLRESLGTIHFEEIGADALQVQLIGRLDSASYKTRSPDLDAYAAAHDRFRLMVDLRRFEGWQGPSALGEHVNLVRHHRHQPYRIAVVGDKSWMKLAETLLPLMLDAKAKYFDEDDYAAGRAWLLT
ncbi:STAS/SEC14 domain-containing protein [Rhodovulum sulfidophilum]|uniref:STAS/SEC14 domain-containing protein n=1 Tax=Rhodovulum sulfidophilum TaxID=35806 RepID=A0A0D6B1U3_RHOSU|nr:STAS/SEC14 domain-containing protein [Rhodovulum sulfidophilum]ANB34937.1 hypothetical protein A6W98_13195 [Rhodovulum sulfidophilum DSM 1374]ANB38759.1 hypothetical protein A6024_13060 [Rhodovulum sulfidophilum]MBL3572547.1 STAS/SEC14 domain-containing protein [Rhodovulum sulfidophilum]MBL3583828.1 STAS/SEC14 domain-containing protein [Rhodovulum sulfidophilum]MBL3608101.1 STAS/SEC14 domain-containing protein [Rhodovulum sulfidophilum]